MHIGRMQTPATRVSPRMGALCRTLLIDATGVSVLTGMAARAAWRNTATGMLAVALVGATGLWAAAVAVHHVASRSDAGARVHRARGLILAGALINTLGTLAVVVAHRRSTTVVPSAATLLVGGNFLSLRYLRQLGRP